MDEIGKRTHVLLMPRDLIHRAVTDPDNDLVGYVTIEQSREKVRGAPELDPNILLQPDLRRGIYEYYGYPSPA